jgi:hypothetical protein
MSPDELGERVAVVLNEHTGDELGIGRPRVRHRAVGDAQALKCRPPVRRPAAA